MDAATSRAAIRAAQHMTPEQHAAEVRQAAEALNEAIRSAALGGVGVTVETRIGEFIGSVVPPQVRVAPWKSL